MNVLRVIGNILIGIVLFALIFGLTFIIRTKKFIEKDLLHEVMRASVEEAYKSNEEISTSQKELIDDMFNDKESSGIIEMVIDNYRGYKNESNYHVSKKDAQRLYDFVLKYKDKIYELSGEDVSKMSEKEFEEFFDQEKIDEYAKDVFHDFDKNVEEEGIQKAIDGYSFATSGNLKIILIISIIACILLLMLINWSLISWTFVTGICLIISGVLMSVIYFLINILKENILDTNIKISINVSSYLITGIIEIVIGIVLLVIYEKFKKKEFNEEPSNVVISN